MNSNTTYKMDDIGGRPQKKARTGDQVDFSFGGGEPIVVAQSTLDMYPTSFLSTLAKYMWKEGNPPLYVDRSRDMAVLVVEYMRTMKVCLPLIVSNRAWDEELIFYQLVAFPGSITRENPHINDVRTVCLKAQDSIDAIGSGINFLQTKHTMMRLALHCYREGTKRAMLYPDKCKTYVTLDLLKWTERQWCNSDVFDESQFNEAAEPFGFKFHSSTVADRVHRVHGRTFIVLEVLS